MDPDGGYLWVLPGPDALDPAWFARRVGRALALRIDAGLLEPGGACRLVNGAGDGLAGFAVDHYAGHVVAYALGAALVRWLEPIAHATANALIAAGHAPPSSLTGKVRPPEGPERGRHPHVALAGSKPVPERVRVLEHGIVFEVHLAGGLNTGLFSHVRDVRRLVARLAPGRSVLNLFAYTGGFSLAAATAGAASATSVDAASGTLAWARANFAANGLDPTDPRWSFADADAFAFLEVARTHRESWDMVILDPPATGHAGGRPFRLESDYGRLVTAALAVTRPDAYLLCAAQSERSRPDGIQRAIKEAARDAGRRLVVVTVLDQPADYPTMLIDPAARVLKGVLVRVE